MGDATHQAILMPWVRLRLPITFCGFHFEHLSTLMPRLATDFKTQLARVGNTFREIDGRTTDIAVVWPETEGAEPRFTSSTLDGATTAVRLLLVAVLASTEFFTLDNPINATHLEVVGQSFTLDSDHISFWTRRRDGHVTIGGYELDAIRVSRPIAAYVSRMPTLDDRLTKALDLVMQSTDSTLARIVTSSDPLRRGNRLDLADSIREDLFWNVTALEQLLVDADYNKGREFAEKISWHLGRRFAASQARSMLGQWAREAYSTRSEVHGKPARSANWQPWVHGLLATEAYTLVVQDILSSHPSFGFSLSDEALQRIDAFPRRVAALREVRLDRAGGDGTRLWVKARKDAQWSPTRRQAADHLRRLLDTEAGPTP